MFIFSLSLTSSFLRFICVLFSYRHVFEKFLTDIVEAFKSGSGPIYDAVGKLNATDAKAFRAAAAAPYPSMSAIDRAVRIPVMKAAVWKEFGFDQDVEYPVLPSDLVYGTLSNAIHNMVFKRIPVSDRADDIYKRFVCLLAERYFRTAVEYSEMDVSSNEEEQRMDSSGDVDGDKKEHKKKWWQQLFSL